jgi:hypothetical protein
VVRAWFDGTLLVCGGLSGWSVRLGSLGGTGKGIAPDLDGQGGEDVCRRDLKNELGDA